MRLTRNNTRKLGFGLHPLKYTCEILNWFPEKWITERKHLKFCILQLSYWNDKEAKTNPLKGSQVRGMNVWTVGPVAQISEIKHDVEQFRNTRPHCFPLAAFSEEWVRRQERYSYANTETVDGAGYSAI